MKVISERRSSISKEKKKTKPDSDQEKDKSIDNKSIGKKKKKIKEIEIDNKTKYNKEIYGDRFEINREILLGKGSFGEIYLANDLLSNSKVALKLDKKISSSAKQLRKEKVVLESLSSEDGFTNLLGYGKFGDINYIAMEVLGPSLSQLFEFCGGHFSLQSVLLIAIQSIELIEILHSKQFIHRDIKPDNFLIGVESKENKIHLIDFGLSNMYKNDNGEHITYKENKSLTGTARYASINNHMGIEQSRRDDLESLGYMIIYFLKKSLPWQGINDTKKLVKYDKILKKKLSTSTEILCLDLPIEFCMYLNYVRALRFNERPNYMYLKGIFSELLFIFYLSPFLFDWNQIDINNELQNLRQNPEEIITKRNNETAVKNKLSYLLSSSQTPTSTKIKNSQEHLLNKHPVLSLFGKKSSKNQIEIEVKNENSLENSKNENNFNFDSDGDKFPNKSSNNSEGNFGKLTHDEVNSLGSDNIENHDITEENSFYKEDELVNIINNIYKPK